MGIPQNTLAAFHCLSHSCIHLTIVAKVAGFQLYEREHKRILQLLTLTGWPCLVMGLSASLFLKAPSRPGREWDAAFNMRSTRQKESR